MRNFQRLTLYLNREVFFVFFAVFTILYLILFGNQFFLVLSQSLRDGIFGSELISLLLLKSFRDIPFVINFSISLSIIYSLNKFYRNSELIILSNSGLSEIGLYRILMPLIIILFCCVLVLSLLVVPEVKGKINTIQNEVKARPDYISIKEGVFQNFEKNDITFYSPKVNTSVKNDDQIMQDFFFYSQADDRLIISDSAIKKHNKNNGSIYLDLFNGKTFDNLSTKNKEFSVSQFEKLTINIYEKPKTLKESSTNLETQNLYNLIKKRDQKNIKEILSRFSSPLSLLIMSLLSIFVSKTSQRNKRNFALGYGLILNILYYNMIQHSNRVNELPNTFIDFTFPHIIFLIFIFLIYIHRNNYSISPKKYAN